MSIKAIIIADSKNEFGNRITSFVLTFPRIILAEFNTHRMLSKNSASSRAIPFEKMVKMVEENPFIPIKWMKDHKGMQGIEYFDYKSAIDPLVANWLQARSLAVASAKHLNEQGLTKQICNRLLEPFMYHTVIATGTEWENFFALRANEAAEIHMQELANKMLEAYNESEPKDLKAGEWHIPFGNDIIVDAMKQQPDGTWDDYETRIKIATARCARVSYNNFEGTDDYKKDIELYDRLLSSGHMSPFEHCAKAMSDSEYEMYSDGHFIGGDEYGNTLPLEHGWCGNFRGFVQLRKTIEGENKTDSRILKK